MKASKYQVIVGNIGTVYSGSSGFDTRVNYNTYVGKSKRNEGRASGESVTLMKDGEIELEFIGLFGTCEPKENETW